MSIAPGITVNGVKISIEQINAEVQYHPALNLKEAKYEAMQALVVRELLLQRAASLGIRGGSDEAIEDLLDRDISIPEPTIEECRRYYENNRNRFYTSPLFEVSHILYLAHPRDKEAREQALRRADEALARLKENPTLFETIAREESACPSSRQEGNIGQIGRGQTVRGFDDALLGMKAGELSAATVPSEVGYHIIRLHRRMDGALLPFEAVQERIAEHLKKQSWQRAFSQYLQILAGDAEISGFRLRSADSPLVQ
jgi:peptidyl-prolyl cis-trans isomerase C